MRRSRLGTMHHLRITVVSRQKSRPFYDAVLGALGYEFFNEDDDRVCYRAETPFGPPQLFLISDASPHERDHLFDLGHLGLHHFAFNADSRQQVDEMYELVCGLGAPTQGPPREYPYSPGFYAVYFRDPDNLKLEVVHVP